MKIKFLALMNLNIFNGFKRITTLFCLDGQDLLLVSTDSQIIVLKILFQK